MKKLNLLSRAEMKNVIGGGVPVEEIGGDICYVSVTYPNGQVGSDNYYYSNGGSGANADCVRWIESGQVASCRYDCLADGVGV